MRRAVEDPTKLEDLITGDIPEKPEQNNKYNAINATWQGAALGMRGPMRGSTVSLGVATIDLAIME